MPIRPRKFRVLFPLVVLSLLPTAVAPGPTDPEGAGTGQNPVGGTPAGCVRIAYANVGSHLNVYLATHRIIGVAVTSEDPGDGVTFIAYVDPDNCRLAGINASAVRDTLLGSPWILDWMELPLTP